MRVATWNVQHGRRPDGVVDPGALAAACASLGVDVLALQEVDRGTERVGRVDLLELAAAATGLHAIDGAVERMQGGRYGNALLLPAPPASVGRARLPRRWCRWERRGVLWAEAGGVVLAACHLGVHRGEAVPQLRTALGVLPPGPAVLLGDLNLHPGQVAPVAGAAGFVVVDVPPAFPAKGPVAAIDHVLVRGVEVREVAPGAARPVVSDHRPVVVELELERYFRSASPRA